MLACSTQKIFLAKSYLQNIFCRYLAEVLYSWQITALNRADAQLRREESLIEQSSKSRNNKKNKKNKKKARLHAKELTMYQVCFVICDEEVV